MKVKILPRFFSRYQGELERAIGPVIPHDPALLSVMQRYHLGWCDQDGKELNSPAIRGKALRPILCLFTCEALGRDWRDALPVAASLELIHNFSLIHDDIQDRDAERRHRPTVWRLWGEAQAIVAGNTMRSLADQTTLNLVCKGNLAERVLRISCLLSQSCLDMIEGQCLDLSYESRMDVTTSQYLHMIERKTGALIRCSVEAGAILATDNATDIDSFRCCGSLLGRAFQIWDDVLGIWGDKDATGKPAGNDLHRKKKSFPIVHALENSPREVKQSISRIYTKETLEDSDVSLLLSLLEESGAREAAHKLVTHSLDEALLAVEPTSISEWARQEFKDLAMFMSSRDY